MPQAHIAPIRRQTSMPQARTVATEVDEFGEDDEALIAALMGSTEADDMLGAHTATSFTSETGQSSVRRPLPTSLRQTTLHGMNTTRQAVPSTQGRVHNWPLANRQEPPTHHKLDTEAMKSWVYPTNLGTTRDYQFNIVHKGLYHNLLVALPTGLGKTFIAATIMLNWFRWTKDAQIIFVAPTKPLVAQQVDACFNVAGIPRSQTTMLTGEVQPAIRAEEWASKRVFFMTPQTLINDLKNGMCDPKKIVLLVVDEAHKATGNYAYVEVVRFIRRFSSSFRVLALTATPGASVEAVQKVIDGLDIARVEIRTEDSLDIRSFVHLRNTDLEIFDYSDEINMSLELFSNAVKPLMNKLNQQNAFWGKDPARITLFGLKKERDKWNMSDAGKRSNWGLKGMVNGIFTVLMGLAHNLELLKFHGIGPFYHKMKSFEDEASGGGKYAKQVVQDEHFVKLMNRLRGWINHEDFVGHPKLSYLKTIVLNHFMDAGEGQGGAGGRPPSDTRIMIFAHYRDSAEEIARVLRRHEPMIRPHVFVGQSGTKGSEGMDQKMQLDIIQKFKKGTYNTLVATSIGEEGLDIGEVDLIVCYDCSKSPIRMLQRMGRTGRKRAGNIVLLLMRDKEEKDYYQAKDNYAKMQEKIECGKEFNFHDDRSMRIVPKEIDPIVDKRAVDIPQENTQAGSLEPPKRKAGKLKKPTKKFNMPDGVETGFSFLGASKAKRSGQGKTPSAKEVALDREEAALPSLETVLLKPEEEVALDERYAQVAGHEPQYVQAVSLCAFPQSQRRLCRVGLARLKHSELTKKLVGAIRKMHDPDRHWARPSAFESIAMSFKDDLQFGSETDNIRSARPLSLRGEELNSPPTSSATVRAHDNYDRNDSFFDDGLIPAGDDAQSDLDTDDPLVDFAKRRDPAEAEEPFYVSQRSIQDETMDEDLPDIGSLVPTKKASSLVTQGRANVTSSKRKCARRIMSDDEDE